MPNPYLFIILADNSVIINILQKNCSKILYKNLDESTKHTFAAKLRESVFAGERQLYFKTGRLAKAAQMAGDGAYSIVKGAARMTDDK